MSSRVVSAFVAAAALVLGWAPPAAAAPPARVTTQITDPGGVLGSGRAAAAAALERLRTQTGITLFVAFVPTFDNLSAQRWTDETARLSGRTGRAALLAVATGDRAYAYQAPTDARISKGEAAAVARNDVEPALTRGDWSGAVVGAADGYRTAAAGTGSFTWVLVLAVVLILVVGGWAVLRRRRGPAPASSPVPEQPVPEQPVPEQPVPEQPVPATVEQARALLAEATGALHRGRVDLARQAIEQADQVLAALSSA
jgi:TPM domain